MWCLSGAGVRVEVAFDHQAQASAHYAIPMTASQAGLHPRDTFVWYALHQANVKVDFVPFDDRSLDGNKR